MALGILLVLDIAYCIYRLVMTFWTPRLRMTSIVFNLAWIVLLSYMATHMTFIYGSELETAGIRELKPLINKGARAILYIIIVVLAVDTLNHGRKLLWPRAKSWGGRESPA